VAAIPESRRKGSDALPSFDLLILGQIGIGERFELLADHESCSLIQLLAIQSILKLVNSTQSV
jgi:hypothetical protein